MALVVHRLSSPAYQREDLLTSILSGADGDRHAHRVSDDDAFLAWAEIGEEAAKARTVGDTGQDSLDIVLVAEWPDHLGTQLGEDLAIDAGGTLIDDEQGDTIFAHLPRDSTEDRLPSGFGSEELVRFFEDDDQWSQGTLPTRLLCLEDIFGIAIVNPAGEQVGDQHVVEERVPATELHDDMGAALQLADDLVDHGRVERLADIGPIGQASQFGPQGIDRGFGDTSARAELFDRFGIEFQCLADPPRPVACPQVMCHRGEGRVEIELLRQEFDVFRFDLVEADLDSAGARTPFRPIVERIDLDPRGPEEFEQADQFRLISGGVRIFVVHVEEQDRDLVSQDETDEEQASQHALAAPALPEDAIGALDELG